MTPMAVIGIDPGRSGAFAALDIPTGELLWVADMPTVDEDVDALAVEAILEREPGAPVILERVGSFGKNDPAGVATVAAMCKSYGVVMAVAVMLRRPLTLRTPRQWKGALGLNSDKERSRAEALRRWPDHAHLFRRKLDADRAEAALIATLLRDTVRRNRPTADDYPDAPW